MQESIFHQIHRLNYLTSELDGLYHQASVQIGLADSAMRILYAIYDNGDGCLLNTIYRQSGISKQTVNSALRKLEADGILTLTETDGRKKAVHLTEAGSALASDTVVKLIEIENRILSGWGAHKSAAYIDDTREYNRLMKEGLAKL